MKIMLHGATSGTNFGDCLFADIFWREVSKLNKGGKNIFFECPRYGIKNFFRKQLGYGYRQSLKDLFTADMLLYISGGYFGERTTNLREGYRRLVKYSLIGILFMIRKKPILILGVGGGPITNKILRKIYARLINNSYAITVRDNETADYFKNYGVKRNIKVTSDTAQTISKDLLQPLNAGVKGEIKGKFKDKKIIFLHALSNRLSDRLLSEKVIPPLNSFLEKHEDYGVIIGYDEINTNSVDKLTVKKKLTCESVYCYDYNSPFQLCSLLNEVDVIITPKLHVGIIGATFSKSVISFPIHPEKTKRYYRQIGEPDRCISLKKLEKEEVKDLLEKLHNRRINLSREIIESANANLEILADAIGTISGSIKAN